MKTMLFILLTSPAFCQKLSISQLHDLYYKSEELLPGYLKPSGYTLYSKVHDKGTPYTMYTYQAKSGNQLCISYWDASARRTVEYVVGEREYDEKLMQMLDKKKASLRYNSGSYSGYEFTSGAVKIKFSKDFFVVDKKRSIWCIISAEPALD